MDDAPLVFVSYASRDKILAERLVHSLIYNGISVWYDKWELLVGHDIVEKVYDGIRRADYLAIVLTQQSVQSKWVKEELNTARMREVEHQRTIVLPLLFEKVEIPAALTAKKYADFTQSFESGLVELLRVFGITESRDDMLIQLARVLEGYADQRILREWDVYARSFNRYAVHYMPGDRNGNSDAYAMIIKKVEDGLENTHKMLVCDYQVLAVDHISLPSHEKHENALWRDYLWKRTWRIAREILDGKQELFLEDIDAFRREVAVEYRRRVLNEIGPFLAHLWTSRAQHVVQNAIHVLWAMLDIQIGSARA